jgi:hypothetical protein
MARPRRKVTVRCEVMSTRRVDGVAVADVLACGHEFVLSAHREKHKEERLCAICTAEKYGPRPTRGPQRKKA